jgi:hypothetical protein
MLIKQLASLTAVAVVAAIAAVPMASAQMRVPDRVEIYTDMPKADPGDDPANWSARRNVVESDRYERLLRTNPAFLRARINKECGGIAEPGAFQQCVDTFR